MKTLHSHTIQLCKLSTVNDLQYVAKQMTALLLTCLQPLLLNRLNLLQPRAKASTPFSVIESHHEILISSKFWNDRRNKQNCNCWAFKCDNGKVNPLTGQPSAKFFKLLSVMLIHDSKLIAVNLEQCLLIAYIAWSVTFLQSDRSNRSILWQCWASVLKGEYILFNRFNP